MFLFSLDRKKEPKKDQVCSSLFLVRLSGKDIFVFGVSGRLFGVFNFTDFLFRKMN